MSTTFQGKTAGGGYAILGFLLGAVFTVILFVGMALAQLMGEIDKDETEFFSPQVSIPPPEIEELEEPPEPPPPEEEPPPELDEPPPDLSLDQLEAALNPGTGGPVSIPTGLPDIDTGDADNLDAKDFVDLEDLDREPRAIKQTQPKLSRSDTRESWSVRVSFIIDTNGEVLRIEDTEAKGNAPVEKILEAIRQWRFETGTVNGRPVQFKISVPIVWNAR